MESGLNANPRMESIFINVQSVEKEICIKVHLQIGVAEGLVFISKENTVLSAVL